MSDREWCWAAGIAALIVLAIHPNAWAGIVAIMLFWTLIAGE